MPASVRVLLLSGHSCSRALLRLLSGLLPSGRFGGGALLGLLSSGGLLSGGNEHTIAAGRWEYCGCVPVAKRMQGSTKPRR